MAKRKPKANKATLSQPNTAILRHKQSQPHLGIRNSHSGRRDSDTGTSNSHSNIKQQSREQE